MGCTIRWVLEWVAVQAMYTHQVQKGPHLSACAAEPELLAGGGFAADLRSAHDVAALTRVELQTYRSTRPYTQASLCLRARVCVCVSV